jgi:hypothetical protein
MCFKTIYIPILISLKYQFVTYKCISSINHSECIPLKVFKNSNDSDGASFCKGIITK